MAIYSYFMLEISWLFLKIDFSPSFGLVVLLRFRSYPGRKKDGLTYSSSDLRSGGQLAAMRTLYNQHLVYHCSFDIVYLEVNSLHRKK